MKKPSDWVHFALQEMTEASRNIYILYIVTLDTWHVTCDMWHLTSDTWHVTHGEVNILSTFQLPSSYGLGLRVSWRFWTKEPPNKWINLFINEIITKVFKEQPRLQWVCKTILLSDWRLIWIGGWFEVVGAVKLWSTKRHYLIFHLMMTLFGEQPLALPGSAKNRRCTSVGSRWY